MLQMKTVSFFVLQLPFIKPDKSSVTALMRYSKKKFCFTELKHCDNSRNYNDLFWMQVFNSIFKV